MKSENMITPLKEMQYIIPNPIKQYEKILKSTKTSFNTCFRSSLVGETISDLDVSNFKTDTGTYFCSIINLFELIELGIDLDLEI